MTEQSVYESLKQMAATTRLTPRHIVMSVEDMKAFLETQLMARRYVAHGGTEAVTIAGVPVVVDRACRPGGWYIVTHQDTRWPVGGRARPVSPPASVVCGGRSYSFTDGRLTAISE